MKRTALIACAALMAAMAAPAFAGEAPRPAPAAATTASQATAPLQVALCDREALTQAAFRNDFGPRPVFVTANEVMNARAAGERWSGMRCMTESQHQRLTRLLNARPSR